MKRGTGSIYQRGDTWWIKYYRNGKPYRESTHTNDPKKAQKVLTLRLAQCATGTFHGLKVERIKVDELAQDFLRDYKINNKKSIRDVTTRWEKHLRPWFSGMRAVNVDTEQVTRYVDLRQLEGAANATINRELAALKRMFNLGRESTPPKVVNVPIFPRLKESNARSGFLEDAQFTKLVQGSKLWFRTLVECGATIGWRHHELLGLRFRQIDLEHKIVRLEPGTTKNDEGREAPMSETMLHLLTACTEDKEGDDYVFTRSNGKPVKDFTKTWRRACTNAGVPGLLFHDLRRTAARNLRRAGLAETLIMKIGGWRTPSVFHRYAITNRQDMAAGMRQYEEHKARMSEFGHNTGTNDGSGTADNKSEKIQ